MRHRLKAAITATLSLLVLASCGAVPQPFRAHVPNPLSRPQAIIDVAIATPADAPVATGAPLAEAVAEALGRYDIQASTRTQAPGHYRISATAEANDGDPASPYVATISWTLEDQDGAPIGLHTHGVLGPARDWQAGEPSLVARVADEAAAGIAKLIADAEGALPAAPGSLRVMHVQGAPGDGDEALTGAMRRALFAAGHTLVAEEEPAAYRLVGAVSVAPTQAGAQAIRIVWQVIADDGSPVGRAIQENTLAAGSLDGRWGKTADAIAAAALPGISQVLRSEGATR